MTSGSAFNFNSYDYYLNVPITPARQSVLIGSFASNVPIGVYLLNTTQWDNNFGPYCPLNTQALLTNSTQGTLDAPIPRGSYDLIFCPVFQPPNQVDIMVRITAPVRLSP